MSINIPKVSCSEFRSVVSVEKVRACVPRGQHGFALWCLLSIYYKTTQNLRLFYLLGEEILSSANDIRILVLFHQGKETQNDHWHTLSWPSCFVWNYLSLENWKRGRLPAHFCIVLDELLYLYAKPGTTFPQLRQTMNVQEF